jgi:hypothetical protein
MSIQKQHILKFIPILNFLSVFFWIKLCYEKNEKKVNFLCQLMKMFACGVGYSIIQITVNAIALPPVVMIIITCLSVYALLLGISCIAVHAQTNILKNSA